MDASTNILNIERYDSYLETPTLIKNVTELANYLKEPKKSLSIDMIRPIMTFFLETEEIMETSNPEYQLQLARCFLYSFRITIPEIPIERSREKLMYRLFHLLNYVFSKLKDEEKFDDNDERVKLLKIANQMDFYVLAKDNSLIKEIFDVLIDIDLQDAISNIAKMINDCDRLPQQILYSICDKINENKNISKVLVKLQKTKQIEFVQGIKSYVKDVNAILLYEKVADMIDISPIDLFNLVEFDICNDDDEIRTESIKLATKALLKTDFSTTLYPQYSSLISRNVDRSPNIRVMVIDFVFSILKKCEDYYSSLSESSDIEILQCKKLKKEIWTCISNRIVDQQNEIRIAIMKNLLKIPTEIIEIDTELLSKRLSDKSHEVRVKCLKLILNIYEKDPENLEWLMETVISLYPAIKDISLYGFSFLMANHSLVDIAQQLNDRKPLISILKDTNEIRNHLPHYKDPISKAILSKYIDPKVLKKIMKEVPKTFFNNALDQKQRPRIFKMMKKRTSTDEAYLIMGLYQPNPLDTSSLLKCTDLSIVKEIAKVFPEDFEIEIPQMIKRGSLTDITVLSCMKNVDIDDETRKEILSKLVSIINKKDKNCSAALKAFAFLYKNEFNSILQEISFKKKDFKDEVKFFARIGDPKIVPEKLHNRIKSSINEMDENTVRSTLRLVSLSKDEETVKIHLSLLEKYPKIIFKSFLTIADEIAEFNTPEVFRTIAYVMQHPECEVRTDAIASLTQAMKNPKTPIQFLALFALSATDPFEKNQAEAKKQLNQAIHTRRKIQKKTKTNNPQIAPETSLPFLIHLLSHHKDFDDDLPDLPTFDTYLRFYLTPLCADTSDFGKILEIFFHMRFLDDIDIEYTDKMVKLCDLASSIVKDIGGGRNWNLNVQETQFEYSSRYFQQPNDQERINAFKQNRSFYIKSPTKNSKILRGGMNLIAKKPKENVKTKSAPTSPSKTKIKKYNPKTPQPKTNNKEENVKKMKASKKASPKPSPRKSPRKKTDSPTLISKKK